MSDVILHHYWGSPYAEKIRRIFAYKGLRWRSLETPPVPPRPSLEPFLGAFRRTPVLQQGADLFCDSRLIAEVVDQLCPERPLATKTNRPLSDLVCGWVEPRAFVMTGPVRFVSAEDVDGVFEGAVGALDFQADRLPFMAPAVEASRFAALGRSGEDHLRSYLRVVEDLLEDGRAYLGGDAPCFADFSVHHLVWWLRKPPAREDLLAAFPLVGAMANRLEAFGPGEYAPVGPEDAFAAARRGQDAPPSRPPGAGCGDARLGRRVSIQPDDYGRDPLTGVLVDGSSRHVTIERRIEAMGTVRVHFPRLGYEITEAREAA